MKKLMYAVMLLLGLSIVTVSCDNGSAIQNEAISYMQAHVFENGEWYPGDYDMDEVEDILVELEAPKFKKGQHAVEVVVDLYGLKQSYIVWLQDKKVMHYEMKGNVNVGRLSRSIYPSLKDNGWR